MVPVARSQLLGAMALLGIANATVGGIASAVAAEGWLGAAADGFGYSWALWAAAILTTGLALSSRPAPVTAGDMIVAAIGLAAISLPASHGVSAVACTLVGAWFLLRPSDDPRLKAAALLLVLMAIDVFWLGAAMLVLGGHVEALDAHVAAALTGAAVQGNAVRFVHGGAGFYVAMGCTWVPNVAMALLLWFAIARSLRPRLRAGDLGVAAGLTLSVVVLNTARLALMSQDAQNFRLAHGPVGTPLFSALVTAISLAWTVWDVRKELLGPGLGGDADAAGAHRRIEGAAS
jgi:hypothetical protein